ncbi:Alpha/Beta hydrolase protein [Xylariaceae sp. FL1651]|nr:Alpha/Beta hydrolase protein [Xylariaceae sp. FL1651]
MPSLKVDPEWEVIAQAYAAMPQPVINDVFDLRRSTDAILSASTLTLPVQEGVQETKHTITSIDGTSIDVHRFVPPAAASDSSPQRAILFVFGGGMVAGSMDIWRVSIKDLAHRTGTQVFAVDYRLAPEHPGPAAVEDVYSAVVWLQSNAAQFNVDPKRVVLNGKSAGGGICAGVALMARDKGLQPPLAAVALVYPMLDDRTVIPADHPLHEHMTWTAQANDLGWKALLGKEREERTDENVPIYCAPARAEDVSGLPDTYIDVGTLDLFRDEDIAYAGRLVAANVSVEFHLYLGVPHGFDSARQIRVAQDAVSNQTRFLRSY